MSENPTRITRIHKDLIQDIELHRTRKFNNSIPFAYASKTYLEDKKRIEEEYNMLLKKLGDNAVFESRRHSRKTGGLL